MQSAQRNVKCLHGKLKALGRCIPLPRHVLPLSWYVSISTSLIWIATKM